MIHEKDNQRQSKLENRTKNGKNSKDKFIEIIKAYDRKHEKTETGQRTC